MAIQMGQESPHQVYSLTWQIQSQSGEIVWEIQGNHALNTWWPPLTSDFCQLAAGLNTWDIPTEDPRNLRAATTWSHLRVLTGPVTRVSPPVCLLQS